MKLLTRFLINCIAVAAAALLLKGVHIDNTVIALVSVTLILSILNTFLKPILILITIPVTVFTFGLFLLVINAFVILLTANLLDSFSIDGFWWALLFSFIVAIVNSIFGSYEEKEKKSSY